MTGGITTIPCLKKGPAPRCAYNRIQILSEAAWAGDINFMVKAFIGAWF